MLWNGITYSFSDFISNGYGQAHGSSERPLFKSYTEFGGSDNDYHLDAADTVARGNGVDLSAYFTTDKDGNERTSWDIGCFSYVEMIPPTSPQNLRILNRFADILHLIQQQERKPN